MIASPSSNTASDTAASAAAPTAAATPWPATPTAHEQVGFELGWDHAHHGASLPAPYADELSTLRAGWLAGQAAFGARTLRATPHVRQWLQLRLHAWLRGRSVELFQVTPNYLAQIDAGHCPITRQPLRGATPPHGGASIDRVRNDAGYAAGNLAVMSLRANHAKGAHGFHAALRIADELAADAARAVQHTVQHTADDLVAGLNAPQWARVAVLCSFVEPLPHAVACAIPMRVLPPNRLRLFNPAQALQAVVSTLLIEPGWSRRVSGFEDLLPGPGARRDFRAFFLALLPRVLEAGKPASVEHARWAVEDAWRHPPVQQRWAAFARPLGAAGCEALVAKAAANRLAPGCVQAFTDAQATEGWDVETRGYLRHAATATTTAAIPAAGRRAAHDERQRELAL